MDNKRPEGHNPDPAWQDRMSVSTTSSNSSESSGNLYRSQSMASLNSERLGVLGEHFRSSYTLQRHRSLQLKELGLNAKNLSLIPRHPRPKRILDAFAVVIKGLQDHVKATENDLCQAEEDCRLKTTGSHSLKVKTILRHKKKLEYLLSKIEELYDEYQKQNRMREGTKAMSKAFEESLGVHKRDSLINVHFGFKECTKTMCAIEAQLESMLGQFQCQIKGILGFARVMPGDAFESSIRFGDQKWSAKGRVAKDSDQKWDNDRKNFNVQINNSLVVKVFESKRLSKSSLGEKHCDILGLFAANPQLLTVNINDIGTIKLNILVQWQPLANFSEKMVFYDPPPKEGTSPRPLSVISSSDSAPSSHTSSGWKETSSSKNRPDLLCDMKDENKKDVRSLIEAIDEEERDMFEWPNSLEEAVRKTRESLDEYKEQSSFLKTLYSSICELDSLLRCSESKPTLSDLLPPAMSSKGHTGRRPSSISLAIETAFDFLKCEECDSDEEDTEEADSDARDSDSNADSAAVSPTSTARSLADSGIESLRTTDTARSLSQPTYSSGHVGLDAVLMQHVVLCDALIENLDNVGLLKAKEKSSLLKLKQQSKVMIWLLSLTQQVLQDMTATINIKEVMQEITGPHLKQVHEFWLSNSGSVYMTVSQFTRALQRTFTATIQKQYDISPDKVYSSVLKKITHGEHFTHANQKHIILTLPQFLVTLLESRSRTMEAYVLEIAAELWTISQLKSGASTIVIRSINVLRDTAPRHEVVRTLVSLLTSSNSDIIDAVCSFFIATSKDKKLLDDVLPLVVAFLEDPRTEIRVGACVCLRIMCASTAMEELIYVAQADTSRKVQAAARQALAALNGLVKSSSTAH